MHLKSTLLSQIPGIVHGFGSRTEPVPSAFEPAFWEANRPRWKQVHATGIVCVTQPAQDCGETDSLYSRTPGIPIPIMTADCVPILFARKDGKAVATIHAGWRGTKARITRVLWEKLAQEGEKPSQWYAAIGPSIGPCCYEVSEELAQEFQAKVTKELGPDAARQTVPKHRHLDLPALNQAELYSIGLAGVEVLPHCTRCAQEGGEPLFSSYRREGSGTRQMSVILFR